MWITPWIKMTLPFKPNVDGEINKLDARIRFAYIFAKFAWYDLV